MAKASFAKPGTRGAKKVRARESVCFIPTGQVVSDKKEAKNDDRDSVPCSIQLDARQFSAESLESLSDFSHIVVVYHFHKLDPQKIEKIARHPRNNPDRPKVGIFAQRGKNRPNQIGVTGCGVERVDDPRGEIRQPF